jgi:hypothetical protein
MTKFLVRIKREDRKEPALIWETEPDGNKITARWKEWAIEIVKLSKGSVVVDTEDRGS